MVTLVSKIDGIMIRIPSTTEFSVRVLTYFEDRDGILWESVPKNSGKLPVRFTGDIIIEADRRYIFRNVSGAYSQTLKLIERIKEAEDDRVIVLDDDGDDFPSFFARGGVVVEDIEKKRQFSHPAGSKRPIRVRKGAGWVQLDPLRRVRR